MHTLTLPHSCAFNLARLRNCDANETLDGIKYRVDTLVGLYFFSSMRQAAGII